MAGILGQPSWRLQSWMQCFTYIINIIIDQASSREKYQLVIYKSMIWFNRRQSKLARSRTGIDIYITLVGILGERIQYDLRKSTFNHLQDLSLSYFSQKAVGRLMARVTSDSGRVSNLMTWGLLDMTWAIVGSYVNGVLCS